MCGGVCVYVSDFLDELPFAGSAFVCMCKEHCTTQTGNYYIYFIAIYRCCPFPIDQELWCRSELELGAEASLHQSVT